MYPLAPVINILSDFFKVLDLNCLTHSLLYCVFHISGIILTPEQVAQAPSSLGEVGALIYVGFVVFLYFDRGFAGFHGMLA